MEKWERRAKTRDSKRRKRRSQDMVVKGRSIENIVKAIVKRGSKK
jgi:hypothetical protein